ncbi:GNAT family N-acetyltransferase [Petrocella sp. FN5]|uniref:GNAT family N-acetyltransferase n=1 Tax=Petrocella sp. FN5 TaxID=3032002 RepID=UPI0023D98261|nr:GNAT family N-acetyltransferase [Petrocella sp. FN5]MDF1618330.1 GNAT family N-acetyltransferase [Petrocella sp. FN5]
MIRRLDEREKDKALDLWQETFVEDGPSLVAYYFNTHIHMNQVAGYMEGDNLIAMAHLNPYQLMWQGCLYNVSYVVGVATKQSHRRQGLMRKMMTWLLRERYDAGDVFSVLMPIDSRLYNQFGFGFIQDVALYKFHYQNLNRIIRTVPNEEISVETSIQLLPIYNNYKKTLTLSQNRGMRDFEHLLKEVHSEKGRVVIVPDGYVIYYDFEDIFVRECIYTSDEGLMNILDYMGSIAGEKSIQWQMPKNNPLKHLIPHMKEHERIEKPFMMARILHVELLFEAMADLLGTCTIKVIDDQILENNHIYRIDGQVSITHEAPDITVDIESLAQWLFGYDTLESLATIRPKVMIHQYHMLYPKYPIHNYFTALI